MSKGRLYKFLSHFVDIKPGEEIIASLLFFYFFLITMPWSIIKAFRTAKLLKDLGPAGLPPAYLLTAILTGFVVVFHSKIQIKLSKQLLITSSLIFFTLSGLFFWLFWPHGGNWLPLVYWVWANVLVVVLITHFWLTVNDVFNPREAKRLIGFFVSGGILGGFLGGILTFFLKKILLNHLLLFAFSMLFCCVFVVKAIFTTQKKRLQDIPETDHQKKAPPATSKASFRDLLDSVRKNKYLVLIASMITATMIVATLIDFQFNTVVDEKIIKDNLEGFYGLFYACVMLFAFVMQLLMTSNLIKRFGMQTSFLLPPVILTLCSLGIAIVPLIAASTLMLFAILIKGSEESLSLTLNQSLREILYIPIAPDLKNKAKVFIDMFLSRFAKGITAIILIVLVYFNLRIPYISIISIIFLVIWVMLILKIQREYVRAIKQNINIKHRRTEKAVNEALDVDYTKLVFDTLESKNRSSVLYAMHVFDLLQQDKLSPEVQKIISQKSDEVKLNSFGDMFGDEGAAWVSEYDEDLDEQVFKTDITEIMSLDSYQDVMKKHADRVMKKSQEAEIEKMELAKAIGLMEQNAPMIEKLETLIYDDSPEVSRYAIESAAKLRKKEHIPSLIHKLGNPLTQEDAITALQKFGQVALKPLEGFLGNKTKDLVRKKAVVNILARASCKESADVLFRELDKKTDDLDTEIIDALDRIRTEKPEINLTSRIAKRKTLFLINKYYRSYIALQELPAHKKNEELRLSHQKELIRIMMNIFKLLGLFFPHEDILKAYQNIKSGTKNSMAYAVELLDNTLKKELRDFILPLIEDRSPAEKEKKFRQLLKNFPKF